MAVEIIEARPSFGTLVLGIPDIQSGVISEPLLLPPDDFAVNPDNIFTIHTFIRNVVERPETQSFFNRYYRPEAQDPDLGPIEVSIFDRLKNRQTQQNTTQIESVKDERATSPIQYVSLEGKNEAVSYSSGAIKPLPTKTPMMTDEERREVDDEITRRYNEWQASHPEDVQKLRRLREEMLACG